MALFIRRRSRPRTLPTIFVLLVWGLGGVTATLFLIGTVHVLGGSSMLEAVVAFDEWIFARLGLPPSTGVQISVILLQFLGGGFATGVGIGYLRLRRSFNKGGSNGSLSNGN